MSIRIKAGILDGLADQIRETGSYTDYAADLIGELDLPDDEGADVWVDPEVHSAITAAYGVVIDLHNELRDVVEELERS